MPVQSFSDISLALDKKEYAPVYLLHGTEPFYIDGITSRLEKEVLDESEQAFNQSVLYGEEIKARTVIDYAREFPMMSKHKLIVVREAQSLRDIKDIEPYFDNINPSTILVLAYKHKKFDGRSSMYKKLKKQAVILESKPLYDNQVEGWIANLLSSKNVQYTPGVTALLSEHLGNNLLRIDKEVDKLITNLKEDQVIDPALVERYIGISRTYNVFELQKAMSAGNLKRVMTIANYFSENTKDVHPIMVVGALYNYFSRLLIVGMNKKRSDKELQSKLRLSSAYFLREYKTALNYWNGQKVLNAMQLLSEFDLKLKGVNNRSAKDSELVKELIYRLMTI